MPNDIQKRIIELRKKAKLSQDEMADKLEMPRTTYAYNETRAKRFSDEFINKLAVYHHVSTYFIRNGLNENKIVDLNSPVTNEPGKRPFTFTNSEKKTVEALRCLSVERQLEIKKMIIDEFKQTCGIEEE